MCDLLCGLLWLTLPADRGAHQRRQYQALHTTCTCAASRHTVGVTQGSACLSWILASIGDAVNNILIQQPYSMLTHVSEESTCVHCRHITHSPALRTCADGVREHSLLDILQAVLTPTPDAVGTWGDGGGGVSNMVVAVVVDAQNKRR
jgi:hypothetical protein